MRSVGKLKCDIYMAKAICGGILYMVTGWSQYTPEKKEFNFYSLWNRNNFLNILKEKKKKKSYIMYFNVCIRLESMKCHIITS